MRTLVANAGSSSLKLSLLDSDDTECWTRVLEAPRATVDTDAVVGALEELPFTPDLVGHRVVHGGTRFRQAVRIDDDVFAALEQLAELAPLHQAKSLATVKQIGAALPDVPAVACFDTAFHATLPAAAFTYALPRAWRERYGLRRYGFHGLSHEYASRRARELVPDAARVVVCHLGAGASLAAVLDGESVDTTMGFTPLEGLVMATRSGSVDPGLLLWLLESEGVSVGQMADSLEHESGLLGLSGTADMRDLLARDDPDSALARDVYLHRLRAGIGAMTVALEGLDVLVFTGGVGERSAEVRELACAGLGHLGVAVAPENNASVEADADISASEATVRTLVIRSREDLEIARQTRAALEPGSEADHP